MATDIGKRIMERRQQLGWTQEELAFRMGYKTKSAINKIELGQNDVAQSKVVRFAEVLRTSVAYLMGWDDQSKATPKDILDEVDVAFYGDYKALDETDREVLREMAQAMRRRREKKQG